MPMESNQGDVSHIVTCVGHDRGQKAQPLRTPRTNRVHVNPKTWGPIQRYAFEPLTPSLRTMQSKPADQGIRLELAALWRACGTSDVRRGETT